MRVTEEHQKQPSLSKGRPLLRLGRGGGAAARKNMFPNSAADVGWLMGSGNPRSQAGEVNYQGKRIRMAKTERGKLYSLGRHGRRNRRFRTCSSRSKMRKRFDRPTHQKGLKGKYRTPSQSTGPRKSQVAGISANRSSSPSMKRKNQKNEGEVRPALYPSACKKKPPERHSLCKSPSPLEGPRIGR